MTCKHCQREIHAPDDEHPWWWDDDKFLSGLCQHNPRSRYHEPMQQQANGRER